MDRNRQVLVGEFRHFIIGADNISYETIYRYIYAEARRGSAHGTHVRQGHKKLDLAWK